MDNYNLKISPEEYLRQNGLEFKPKGDQLLLKECFFDGGCNKKPYQHFYMKQDDGAYYCHKCNAKGSFSDFQRHFGDKPSFPHNIGVMPLNQEKIKPEITEDLIEQYHKALPERIQGYLGERGIGEEIIKKFKIGWNDIKITIPIYDSKGKPSFFMFGRDPDKTGDPKMMSQKGSHAELYGWENINNKVQKLVICEGIYDKLCLESQGIATVTSTLGASSFPKEAIEPLSKIPELYICYDRDNAGVRAVKDLDSQLPNAKIVELPFPIISEGTSAEEKKTMNKDVTDFFVKYGKSKEDFSKLLDEAKPLSQCPDFFNGDEQVLEKEFVQRYLNENKNKILEELGDKNYCTLLVLCDFIGKDGKCFPSQKTIGRKLSIKEDAAKTRIKNLKKCRFGGRQLIKIRKSKDPNGKWAKNNYIIFPELPRIHTDNNKKTPGLDLLNPLYNANFNEAGGNNNHTNINMNNTGEGEELRLYEGLKRQWASGRNKFPGLSTGFNELDRIIGGLRKGKVIVVGGLSGVGKTTFALNIAFNVSSQENKVVYFALQNSADELKRRLICKEAKIVLLDLEAGKLEVSQKEKIEYICKNVESLPLKIYKEDLNVSNISSKLKQIIDGENPLLLIIDYLQNIGLGKNIYEKMTSVMNCLEHFAQYYQISILAISQLKDFRNQAGKVSTKEREPVKADLEGGQTLHQRAQVVLLLQSKGINQLLIKVDKNNDGEEKKVVSLKFEKQYFKLGD